MKRDEGILFSGGAAGAEAAFGACAEAHGVEEVNFTFDGHKIARHRGVRGHDGVQAIRPADAAEVLDRFPRAIPAA